MRTGYYFGAGISLESIPLALDMPDRILELAKKIKSVNIFQNTEALPQGVGLYTEKLYSFVLEQMLSEWEEISNAASGTTIDTIVKANLDNTEFVNKTKRVLNSYLLLEQTKNFPFEDNRYTHKNAPRIKKFIVDLYKNHSRQNLELENNPIIFSWNYDIQFEMSLIDFIKNDTDKNNQIAYSLQLLNVAPHSNFVIPIKDDEIKHVLFKINGTAGLNIPPEESRRTPFFYPEILEDDFKISLKKLLNNYSFQMERIERDNSDIKFAFDGNQFLDKYKLALTRYCSKINRLYVMGYSFPISNKKIDEFIFSLMTNLKEIIIYDTEESKENLIEKANIRSNNSKVMIKYYTNLNSIPIFG